jgi:prepilin-type N-terminal cleavage/methylation domain-containing protein
VTPGCPRRHRKSAYTLIELVMAMAVFTVLLGGVSASLFIAARSVPGEDDATFAMVDGSRAADRLADELKSALWLIEHTATAVTFTVPDRNADHMPERIRYAWSGTAGGPLTRSYNGATAVNVIESVESLGFDYTAKSTAETYPGPLIESAETLLAAYETPVNSQEFDIKTSEWIGQYFPPALPADAVSWKVTRVQVSAKYKGATEGITAVQLRTPGTGNLPSTTVLEQQFMDEANLTSSYAWTQFAYSTVKGLDPHTGLCLTLIMNVDDAHVATVQYDGNAGSNRLQTKSGEGNWAIASTESMLYRVYGTYSYYGPDQTATREHVTGVRIALQPTGDDSTALITTAYLLNRPELLSGLWELDFDTDPTLDLNGDGTNDWSQRGGGSFNTANLSGDVWQANATLLDSSPISNFVGLTTIETRFRATSASGEGTVLLVNADWGQSRCAALKATLQFDGSSSQTLRVYHKTDAVTDVALLTRTIDSTDFVTLRMLIDPALDTVNVLANDVECGTFAYARILPVGTEKFVTIGASAGTAEFDSVSVRVNEGGGVGGVAGGGGL